VSVQATFSATLVDEWVRLGVTDAVICPGSRSTPLAVTLAERLQTHVRLDERSAAFFALGLALSTGRPTVICVTSGTAAAELHPAVVEAHQGRVPLIVCTADRPPELHGIGATQTIEQVGLFASATRWSFSPGVPAEGQEAMWRPLAVRAFAEALSGPRGPGPVHLNLAFREPLIGKAGALPSRPGPLVGTAADAVPDRVEPLGGTGVIVVGGVGHRPPDAEKVMALAARLGWPVLADPLSRCRLPGTIGAADPIVRSRPPLPGTIVLLGTPWLSRALGEYVSAAAADRARVVVVNAWWQWADPLRAATEIHHVSPDAFVDVALASASSCGAEWLDSWRTREQLAQQAIDEVLGADLNEPSVARAAYRHAADRGATLVVAASMPVRDVEWFAPPLPVPPRVLTNRGANGIDGVVSTALGVAASGSRTVALLGDLAFLHDVSGLVNLPDLPCTFVVPDNAGGGIFSFLPQAGAVAAPTFEHLFGTPPTSKAAEVARGFGLPVREVTTVVGLEEALADAAASPRPGLIRAMVPGRAENVALHDAVNEAVRLALT
jgi:2-succinyl-5-enolpyruvyl-6-hydroxy-3-cyclohexene-1-carboxylate synthase